jgi:hypothetical protein
LKKLVICDAQNITWNVTTSEAFRSLKNKIGKNKVLGRILLKAMKPKSSVTSRDHALERCSPKSNWMVSVELGKMNQEQLTL